MPACPPGYRPSSPVPRAFEVRRPGQTAISCAALIVTGRASRDPPRPQGSADAVVRRRSKPARPYICRLTIFILLGVPSPRRSHAQGSGQAGHVVVASQPGAAAHRRSARMHGPQDGVGAGGAATQRGEQPWHRRRDRVDHGKRSGCRLHRGRRGLVVIDHAVAVSPDDAPPLTARNSYTTSVSVRVISARSARSTTSCRSWLGPLVRPVGLVGPAGVA
jgi:hypothetical protein